MSPDAYGPDGITLWWDLDIAPGKLKQKFGAEQKLAAWLACEVEVGETFTMPALREALGDGIVPEDAEHLNRRLRKLREDGWDLPTTKDDASLPQGFYRLRAKGWHPALGQRPKKSSISLTTRRRVLERDNRRCVICGVASREAYPGEPESAAVLTMGHREPNKRGGSNRDPNNLQVECKRCNEPIREALRSPETLDEIQADVLSLKLQEARKLEGWVLAGHRQRDRVDEIFDRARLLSADDKLALIDLLSRKVRGSGTSSIA